MKDLLEHAKEKAREAVAEVESPGDDIDPLMVFKGPYGLGIMPMSPFGGEPDIFNTDEYKDGLAVAMTATITVARAEEVICITSSWMVKAQKPEGDKALLTVQPRHHPERQEVVILMRVGPDGDSMTSAPVTRYPDRNPTLGEWETYAGNAQVGGRFGDAVHMGMDFAKKMPKEMLAIIDAGWAAGEQTDLIQRFIKVASTLHPPERKQQ